MTQWLSDQVSSWNDEYRDDDADGAQIDYLDLLDRIDYLSGLLYGQYAPTSGPYPLFADRLEAWLRQVEPHEQKTLLRLVPNLFFTGEQEMTALCRSAFNGPVYWWISDQIGAFFDADGLPDLHRRALEETWFCPLTDSMPIAHFCHVNRIEGQKHRPDWRSLALLGDAQKIVQHMESHSPPLQRLVLLEDFVGSGTQMRSATKFAATLAPAVPVLVVPFIVCPKGAGVGIRLTEDFPNVTFSPLIQLPDQGTVPREASALEDPLVPLVREIATKVHPLLKPFRSPHDDDPFGFKGTGALAVGSGNCPNNTLPLVHHSSPTWKALFPRSSRT